MAWDEQAAARRTAAGWDRGFILLSDVEPEDLRWRWAGWMPEGKLTLLDGDPGTGKSTLASDLAARVTTGRAMPLEPPFAEPHEARAVIMLVAEDGLGDTVVKRIMAAGGNRSLVAVRAGIWRGGSETTPPTIADIEVLRSDIEKLNAALVIIDPLVEHLGLETYSYNDQEVRRALAPLARLAAETGVAILMIRHLRKGGSSKAIYEGGGSIGFAGAARSVMYCAKDPTDESRRILASAKSNLSATPKSLVFRPVAADGDTSRIEWIGESEETADSLASGRSERRSDALMEAKVFLQEMLADGPMAATEVESEARGAGISKATLRRAREGLGVRPRKGDGGAFYWRLPTGSGGQDAQGAHLAG